MMRINRLNNYVLPSLAFGAIVSLAVVFRSFIMANLVEPVAYLCWAIWGIISSVNQNFYWLSLIALCLFLMIRLVPHAKNSAPSKAHTYKYSRPNPIKYWQALLQDATLGRNESENLRDGLKKLLEAVIAQVEPSDPKGSDDVSAIGKVPLSPAALRFLFPLKGRTGMLRPENLELFTPKWFRRRIQKFFRQDTAAIDAILEQMETEMELSHDR